MAVGNPTIDEVRSFWEADPCGAETGASDDRREYFQEVERYRYGTAPSIPEIAEFPRFAAKRVLEIGCGLGTDGARFASAGADYVGVDLTDAAIALARENFVLRGLTGRFERADAENLPFDDSSFDHVYSFGVIHHSTHPERIVEEIRRVLVPGGTVTVMLYNRDSINYRVEIMVLRKLGRALLRPAWSPPLLARTLRVPQEKLEGHREMLLRLPRPTHDEWVSMNTDGPGCPLARVYSASQAKGLFGGFADVTTEVRHFDRSHWPVVGGFLSDEASEWIGRRVGWLRIVRARKPRS